MSNSLKMYSVELTCLSPVFVGSGKQIGKKEYVFLSRKEIGIPTPYKLYAVMKSRGKAKSFEDFLVHERKDLNEYLLSERMDMAMIEKTFAYTLKTDEVMDTRDRRLEIHEFVKDAYGMPYVPGTSIKGMLRTILLAQDIMNNSKAYDLEKGKVGNTIDSSYPNRNILNREMKDIESKAFCKLKKSEKMSDAVNDILQGMIVSDSEPLTYEDLTLCQRIELHADRTEKKLNVMRECLKPSTKVRFQITIDHTTCKYTMEDIQQAINNFADQYYNNFAKVFAVDRPKEDTVYLGGGVGYVSKTIIYPLFGKDEGVKYTAKIFEKTKVPEKHKHREDVRKGVSPHILKCTRYAGKLYQMGMCEFKVVS